MTRLNEDVVGVDSSIFMHPTIWKASGHVDSFNDPMLDNKDSKKRYRADVLLEEHAAELEKNGEVERARKVIKEMARLLDSEDLAGVHDLIVSENIKCPISGTANWTEVRQFNLMFATQIGALAGESATVYLRPETAQGIFVNFLNVQKSARKKIPFGIAQIGKAFRNEIVARQFIFRMREFEQMEMQFFIRPGDEMQWYEHWKNIRMNWHKALGVPAEKLRTHDHEKLAHYANAALDIEYEFPFGFKEVEGIHSRTDFDLASHQEFSKKKLQYFDPELNKSYVPYVVETSVGADRLFLMILCNAYTVEETGEGENKKTRTFLKFHPALAPVKAAILPLVKKDGLPEKAREIFDELKYDFNLIYEEAQSIGKRYTRQDLIGTPFCIAVDHQTLEDNTVTLRHRDTTEQERLNISELRNRILKETSFRNIFEKL
jgi:glycyl-tRNA synthetase